MEFPDLVQECAREFYKAKHKYNPEYELSTFAYAVMRNCLRNIRTLAKSQKRSGRTVHLSQTEDAKTLGEALEDKSRHLGLIRGPESIKIKKLEKVRETILKSRLTEVEKRRLIKHFLDGKERNQIALEEKVTNKAVGDSIRRALKKIKYNQKMREYWDLV